MKKIISLLLMLCMAFTMLAGTMVVSADEATTSADPKVVTLHSFNGLTVGKVFSQGGSTASDAGTISANTLHFRKSKNGGTSTVMSRGEGDNYISTTHNHIGYNYRKTPNDFT